MLPENLPEGLTEAMVAAGAAALNQHDMESGRPGPDGWRSLEQSAVAIWSAMESAKGEISPRPGFEPLPKTEPAASPQTACLLREKRRLGLLSPSREPSEEALQRFRELGA